MEDLTGGALRWMSKACEAWRLWTDANLHISRQLTDFGVNVGKEHMSLYAEVYATNVEAMQEGQTYTAQRLQEMPETMRHPGGMGQKLAEDFATTTGKLGKLAQNNAQAVLRSSEQYWLTTQHTGTSIKDTYAQLYNKLASLYTTP